MKRSDALAPLSRDHHQALEVALRLRRATESDLDAARTRFEEFFEEHGRRHFEIEERLVLPAIEGDEQWERMNERVLAEHDDIRRRSRAIDSVAAANELGELLHGHVRFEEREQFEFLEGRLDGDRLEALGRAVAEAAEEGT